MTNDVQTQANVGLARWFVNKLRSASQMANATPDVPSQSLKTGSRGCAAPLTKEEVAQNQAEIQQNNADPTAFVNKDVYDLATGDISEKTTAALNLVELGLTFTAPAGRLGGGQQFVRDMGLGMNRTAAAGTNALKPLGLGSTGRTVAINLAEQLAMKQIMSNPSSGKVLIQTMKDASGRWNGWSKMSNKTAHGVEIHYNALWEGGEIKAIDDFKFIEKK